MTNSTWTTQQRVNLSLELAKAYGGDLTNGQATPQSKGWTTDQLANLGTNLTRGFGVGL